MTFLNILYTLSIRPLELLFDVIFAIVNRSVKDPGITILVLSIVVNLLVLPLYRRADAMQADSHEQEKKLKHWVDHIKKTFTGDERFMMTQTYYRQNNYKPLYALKGSLSLLLEIPFFIAAYRFLSGLMLLNGVSFGPIKDLSAPDAMLTVFGVTINVLPVLMTLINIISAAIYMKGFPLKSKIQMYGMALVFLILLYGSPSGLVLYWTMNNVFSLVKNIFYKLKDPGKVIRICLFLVGVAVQEYVLIMHPFESQRKTIFAAAVCLLLQMPLVLSNFHLSGRRFSISAASKDDDAVFLLGCIFMSLLTGTLISSSVIKASPADFINLQIYYSPLWFVLCSFLLAAGTFLLWFGIFYKIATPAVKKIMSLAMWVLSFCSAVNYMFFGTERGDISSQLVYDISPADSGRDYLINLVVLLGITLLLVFIWKKRIKIVQAAALALCLTAAVMSFMNVMDISRSLSGIKKTVAEARAEIPVIPLSKNGKNVVILMMDRSIGYYIPFIMAENPELMRQFDGFTFYPNTLSHGASTNLAIPSLYGGYEYLPEKINERADESLIQKHNEALRMMPVLFDDAGYDVTIFSPSYANYKEPSDLHIYDDHPDIKAYNVIGMFTSSDIQKAETETLNRNFFCFSIYKTAPLVLQPTLYSYGLYNESDAIAGKKGSTQTSYGILSASGLERKFIDNYNVLVNLPEMTKIVDTDNNTYFSMDNGATHEPVLLQMPDYTVEFLVDNHEFDTDPAVRTSLDGRQINIQYDLQMEHYHTNMASYKMLGRWLDWLRENGVYDNTRIIIAADHGIYQVYREHMFGKNYIEDVLLYNPVLMVKDFNTHEFKTDDSFMTNADVPTLAVDGLFEDPVNPFTGNPITNDAKNDPVHYIIRTDVWDINANNGNTFLSANWYALHGDNVFDVEKWEKLERK